MHIFTPHTDVKTPMKKHIANMLTLCRVFGSMLLLFFPFFSAGFYTVYIPGWLLIWTAVIAGVRTIGGIIGKKLIMPHTIPNKLTGSMLFLMPLTVGSIDIGYSGAAVCCAATCAALHDCYCAKKSGL